MTTKATLLKAIRLQCVECFGGSWSEVDGCTSPKCSLYPYRSGKDPSISKTRSEQSKRTAAASQFGSPNRRSPADPTPVAGQDAKSILGVETERQTVASSKENEAA